MQKFKRIGQAATEYLIVIAISLLFLTPVILMGNNAVVDLKRTTDNVVARDAVDKITDMSRIVYAQGVPAKITNNVRFPGSVLSTTVSNQMIIIKISAGSASSDIFNIVDFNVTGNLPMTSGVHRICVEAVDYGVNISVAP
ncbi:MAG: hypothetical protein DRN71_05055 [Candidatus Nanohalarchaeota archaeon]|nr:MAG: hypothetical protein DRN71_05055 [Candidatus Nanohaloarchaeota archaeon]